jgi:D-alanine-D-alanine ligase
MVSLTHKKRVAILRGGPSSEYDVSMKTGKSVMEALGDEVFVRDIVISKKGEWLVNGFVKSEQSALMDIDVAFIALHGTYGEDGTVQRILERYNIPYTGSGPFASSVALNKSLTKDFLKKHSSRIKLAPHIKINKNAAANIASVVHAAEEMFGPEYVIKPIDGGSSIGTLFANKSNLLSQVQHALSENEEVIIEERIRGKEATVGILEGFRGETIYRLPAVEIVPPADAEFFNYEVKYNGTTEEICPGRFSKTEKEELQDLAAEVHELLQLSQYSRSDFIVAEDGIYFLEVNTLPGLTSQSLFPKMLDAVGGSYKQLILHLIETV